jgi:hypothetical protein
VRLTETLAQFEARIERETNEVHARELADINRAYDAALQRAMDKHKQTFAQAAAIEMEKPLHGADADRFEHRRQTLLRTLYRRSGLLRDIAAEMRTAKREARKIVAEANSRLREINLEEYHGADRYD